MNDSLARNKNKIRLSLVVAALLALLLWNTQWSSLRPGLAVLLAGQVAIAGFLFFRRKQLPDRRAAWLENGSHLLGFMLLGLGFWRMTGNLIVSVVLGIGYPALSFCVQAAKNKRSMEEEARDSKKRAQSIGHQTGQLCHIRAAAAGGDRRWSGTADREARSNAPTPDLRK